MPGDIKYKDINGDGIIDGNDKVAIGATTKPNLIYGFGMSAKWKGLDVNVHFQDQVNLLSLLMELPCRCLVVVMDGEMY